MAALQRPPIPQAPLVDQNGFVTREWWRWFASIGVVVADQAGSITTIKETVDIGGGAVDVPPSPILADPVDTANVVRQAAALQMPPDPLPTDQLALAPQLLMPPADPVSADQLVMLALMLQLLRN